MNMEQKDKKAEPAGINVNLKPDSRPDKREKGELFARVEKREGKHEKDEQEPAENGIRLEGHATDLPGDQDEGAENEQRTEEPDPPND
jgi:hypothetical protein